MWISLKIYLTFNRLNSEIIDTWTFPLRKNFF